ncbi:hypothetical protein CLAFUW4_13315 [Fulvia fulva]|uniref:Amidoligase enzyme-domain-containing protein n=1 Tax=Passalora fulva TaxID=5499 RepID=A0A9Q8UV97_PASFU|nr:uncharacterized protein CLAFUR5_13169 [Fulvia fulva]KAK4612025.1 hypothetical protein CLAFUR4_13320 [Fulvia fulva]UJO23769.1 hypothetical protein CLAFUR5_13169 [Fulvia fulva]WPV20887.1 hypothetical protein CLAFUW4_13315 [Fulvia fulva]WPV36411.1 hypothetical protein CLAFUW7_13322 [Fulvia fulva]
MDSALTFGVELEFVAVYAQNTFTNTPWKDLIWKKDVDLCDSDFGNGQYVEIHHALHYFLRKHGLGPSFNSKNTEPYTTWSIKEELTELTATERALLPDTHVQRSVEISSPILRLDDPSCSGRIQQVLTVLRWIEQNFDCRFITNETCGHHVHFAHGKKGFSIDIAKRIYQIFLAHERAIDSIHAASRVTAHTWRRDVSEEELKRPDYASLTSLHVNGHLYHCADDATRNVPHDRNLITWLQNIEECQSYRALCRMFELQFLSINELYGHATTVNFDNMFLSNTDIPKSKPSETIEFRQHLGTLDFTKIYRYVHFLGYIITYCMHAPDTAFLQTLLAATQPDYTFEDLCKEINMPADITALFHYIPNPEMDTASAVPELPKSIPNLLAQNAHENTTNYLPTTITPLLTQKFQSLYYGINPSTPPITLSQEAIYDRLFSICTNVGHQPPTDIKIHYSPHEAWSIFLKDLASAYGPTTNTLTTDRAAYALVLEEHERRRAEQGPAVGSIFGVGFRH